MKVLQRFFHGAKTFSRSNYEDLIRQNTDKRFLGIFGKPGVNVLKLNLVLDGMQTKP